MQFSPKTPERYTAALRESLHKKIIHSGTSQKRLKILRKINLFSILSQKAFLIPTDTYDFLNRIFAVCIVELIKKGIFLKVRIKGYGIKDIDRRVLTVLICEIVCLAVNSRERLIKIEINEKEIKITYYGKKAVGYLLKLISKAKGRYLRIEKENLNCISIPCLNTLKSIEDSADIKQLLLDPLSPIKIHLSSIKNARYI